MENIPTVFLVEIKLITIGDNIVSEIWTDVTAYDNPSFGSNGEVKAVYGSTDIYFLFTFD